MYRSVLLIVACGYSSVNALHNLALGKPAYQTDQYDSASADLAVDGNTDGDYHHGSCSHTSSSINTWWEVDLGRLYAIDHVTIHNRMDQHSWRLRDVQLFIGNSKDDYSLKGFHAGQVGTSYTFNMTPYVNGRWVMITRITHNTNDDPLQLCEVQVFEALRNLALGKPAFQTDQFDSASADKAVDGNTDGDFYQDSCAHTNSAINVWWEVDLGRVYALYHITIHNRVDCCSWRLRDVQLFIGNSKDDYSLKGFHAGQVGTSYTFNMSPSVNGRWVMITQPTDSTGYDPLQLCEVQVIGDELSNSRFLHVDGKIGSGVILESSQSRSRIECCSQCKMTTKCLAVNYNSVKRMCDHLETVTAIVNSNENIYFYQFS